MRGFVSGFESLTSAMRRRIWTSMARLSHLNTGEQYKQLHFCSAIPLYSYIFVTSRRSRKKKQIFFGQADRKRGGQPLRSA